MSDLKLSCPNCQQHIACDESYQGAQINCPNCAAPIVIPESAAPTASLIVADEVCPECDTPLPADAILCTQCGYNVNTKTRVRTVKQPTRRSGSAGSKTGVASRLLSLPQTDSFMSLVVMSLIGGVLVGIVFPLLADLYPTGARFSFWIGMFLAGAGLTMNAISNLRILINGFRESVFWGLGFFIPIVGSIVFLVFVIQHWRRNGILFLTMLGSVIPLIAGFAIAFKSITAAEMATRSDSSEFTTTSSAATPGTPISARNYVLNLDGNNSWVELPTGIFADLNESTIECWVKWDSFQNSSRVFDIVIGNRLVDVMNRGNTPNLWAETFVNGNRLNLEATSVLRLNRWTHVALTTGRSQISLYIDGRLHRQKPVYARDTFRSAEFGRRNVLGHSNAKNIWPNDQELDGELDDVRVWNRIRTPSEISAGMNSKLTGNEPGLVGFWKFDDPSKPGRDSSAGSHHAKLIGNAALTPRSGNR